MIHMISFGFLFRMFGIQASLYSRSLIQKRSGKSCRLFWMNYVETFANKRKLYSSFIKFYSFENYFIKFSLLNFD
ncbi:hypothetical protein ACB092_05G188700 [Castanea dentata]